MSKKWYSYFVSVDPGAAEQPAGTPKEGVVDADYEIVDDDKSKKN